MGSSCSDVCCSVAARHQVLTAFLYLLVEVEYTAVVLTQLLDCLRRYEAAAYKLLHRTLGNPLRILHVTLATRELLDEIRIGKIQLEVWRQHTPYWNPVDAGALH